MKAVAMWDFSWIERRAFGGEYVDPERILDELVDRGYDAVRIDAFPHLLGQGVDRATVVPIWTEHRWGSWRAEEIVVRESLLSFLDLAQSRGVSVCLSSWFRQDTEAHALGIRSPEDLARVWSSTLTTITDAGLRDSLWFVDLCNEWPTPVWASFLHGWRAGDPIPAGYRRWDPVPLEWSRRAVAALRAAHPEVPLTMSVSDDISLSALEPVEHLDLVEPHIWLAHPSEPGFYDEIGYDLLGSLHDAREWDILAERAEATYRADEERWRSVLTAKIHAVAEWSRTAGKPVVTTEGWALVNWDDRTGLDWGWIKEVCEIGVDTALATGRWAGLCTSNFCGPQFPGMWGDVEWHRRLTARIRATEGPAIEPRG